MYAGCDSHSDSSSSPVYFQDKDDDSRAQHDAATNLSRKSGLPLSRSSTFT
jgi:hypothetical protein